MVLRVVVIGGDAAGGSAASGIRRRLGDEAHVVVLERQRWTSYAACGIPYWIAGDSEGPDGLVARTPEQHRANGLDLHTGTEATGIDINRRAVRTATEEYRYDHLVIATGATELWPALPGIDADGVHPIHTLDDGLAVMADLERGLERAAVVGAGYIGVEMAEAGIKRGLATCVFEQADRPVVTLDPDMSELVCDAMTTAGVDLRLGVGVTGFRTGRDGRLSHIETTDGTHQADIAFVAVGVRPQTDLAKAAGLPLGKRGGLLTNDRMQVLGHENIWAAGDCVEPMDRLTGRPRFMPLGTHANKQGRVVGVNIAGGQATYPGMIGTAITKFLGTEVSRVGIREVDAADLGFDVRAATTRSRTHAAYYPGSERIWVKLIGEVGTGRLLGGQIVGGRGAGKRIDTLAAAIWGGLSVGDLVDMDLAYAPPLSGVWDPVQVTARRLADQL